jgi:hypothetical protein
MLLIPRVKKINENLDNIFDELSYFLKNLPENTRNKFETITILDEGTGYYLFAI